MPLTRELGPYIDSFQEDGFRYCTVSLVETSLPQLTNIVFTVCKWLRLKRGFGIDPVVASASNHVRGCDSCNVILGRNLDRQSTSCFSHWQAPIIISVWYIVEKILTEIDLYVKEKVRECQLAKNNLFAFLLFYFVSFEFEGNVLYNDKITVSVNGDWRSIMLSDTLSMSVANTSTLCGCNLTFELPPRIPFPPLHLCQLRQSTGPFPKPFVPVSYLHNKTCKYRALVLNSPLTITWKQLLTNNTESTWWWIRLPIFLYCQ